MKWILVAFSASLNKVARIRLVSLRSFGPGRMLLDWGNLRRNLNTRYLLVIMVWAIVALMLSFHSRLLFYGFPGLLVTSLLGRPSIFSIGIISLVGGFCGWIRSGWILSLRVNARLAPPIWNRLVSFIGLLLPIGLWIPNFYYMCKFASILLNYCNCFSKPPCFPRFEPVIYLGSILW